jgi:hypothetical protein
MDVQKKNYRYVGRTKTEPRLSLKSKKILKFMRFHVKIRVKIF